MNIRFLTLAQKKSISVSVGMTNGNLGRGFLDELDRGVRLIKSHPLASTEIDSGIRRCLLHRFPYALIYGIDGDTIVVIAVAHLHRTPRYWSDRMDE
jgi:hypothetical protein